MQENPLQTATNNGVETAALDGPIPRHIAIVMDGNGRWAQKRGLPRPEGHIRGSEVVKQIVEEAARLGVERLTLYCFSSENWKRPKEEVDALMSLLKNYMIEERPKLMKNNIRLRVIGRREGLPQDALDEIDKTIRLTANNAGLTLALAINYGSRAEIVDAVRAVADDLLDPEKLDAALKNARVDSVDQLIDERYFAAKLYDGDAPEPELLLRPGGERRLSNYLLWQLSYAELWFDDVLWPDFTPEKFREAIRWYQGRARRFGDVSPASLK
ncbi:MAG: di-trans,poly-cis-decaprenylcistransferase [Thermoguttaceae bacterium]|nr:di-trans,poly-cis-decaprenylcistransferase [Thermoguttaceae bacterium]